MKTVNKIAVLRKNLIPGLCILHKEFTQYCVQKYYVIILCYNITLEREGFYMDEKTAVERLQGQYKRQNEFIKEKYDRLAITTPKGTKDRITAVLYDGETVNGFVKALIEEELQRRENGGRDQQEEIQDKPKEEPKEELQEIPPKPKEEIKPRESWADMKKRLIRDHAPNYKDKTE